MIEVTLKVKVNIDESSCEAEMLNDTLIEIFDHGIDNARLDDSFKEDIVDNIVEVEVV